MIKSLDVMIHGICSFSSVSRRLASCCSRKLIAPTALLVAVFFGKYCLGEIFFEGNIVWKKFLEMLLARFSMQR